MKAAVLTDGTFELPERILSRDDHFGFYLSINFADGKTINQQITDDEMVKFYDMIDAAEQLPTTSQVRLPDLYDIYDRLVAEGYDTAFVAVIATGLSGTVNTLQNVAQEYADKIDTRVIVKSTVANGATNVAVHLFEAIDEGLDVDTIEQRMRWLDDHQNQWAIVGDINHLVKGGRASRFAGFLGNLVRIVPLIKAEDDGGLNLAGKAHTTKRAMKKIIQWIEEDVEQFPNGGTIQIFHADNEAGAEEMKAKLQEALPDNFDYTIEWLNPVIGLHVGRGTLGFTVMPDMSNYEGQ